MAAFTRKATLRAATVSTVFIIDRRPYGAWIRTQLRDWPGRVQVEIVRHDRRPDDGDGPPQHSGLSKSRGQQRIAHSRKLGCVAGSTNTSMK